MSERTILASMLLLSLVVAPCAAGAAGFIPPRSEPLPHLDIDATCRDQARYAFAATLGQADVDKEFAACMGREQAALDVAGRFWARASIDQRRDCVALSGAKYSTLGRCLEPRR